MFTKTLIRIVRLSLRQGRFCTLFDNLFKSMLTLNVIGFDVILSNLDFPVHEIFLCMSDKDLISKNPFSLKRLTKA